MKATFNMLPREVKALVTEVEAISAGFEKIASDVSRAKAALREAEDLDDRLQELHQRRAEQRGRAFVDGTQADMQALDRELEHMEQSSRDLRETGAAAKVALDLLDAKRVEQEAMLAASQGKLTAVLVEWLNTRRDEDIKRFIAGVEELGALVADASACDVVRRAVSPAGMGGEPLGIQMLHEARANGFAIPRCLYVDGWPPVKWVRSHFLTGREQYADRVVELAQVLRVAGVAVDAGVGSTISNSTVERFATAEAHIHSR